MADAPSPSTIHAAGRRPLLPWSALPAAVRSLDALLCAWSASTATGVIGAQLTVFAVALSDLSDPPPSGAE
ncbi:hypothetical protein ABZZ80_26310 [Streptomyces sp. NPDC006356]